MMFFAEFVSPMVDSLIGGDPASTQCDFDGLERFGMYRWAKGGSDRFTVRTDPSGSRVRPSSAKRSSLAWLETWVQIRVLGSSSAIAFVNFSPSNRCHWEGASTASRQ